MSYVLYLESYVCCDNMALFALFCFVKAILVDGTIVCSSSVPKA